MKPAIPEGDRPRQTRCLDDATIDDYVHARLSADARAAAETHVDACADCSTIVSVLAGGRVAPEALPEADVLAKGTAIGRHVVVELRGEGAMGIVYLAYDPELDRKVALKLLRPGSAPGAGERMQREAQAMAKIAHPNVVAVHDVGRFRGAVYLAMEFVAGRTLRAFCMEEDSADERLAAVVAAGRGLAAAHDAGLVHRDFKPENVLVGSDGRVRVTDFGLARVDVDAEASRSDLARDDASPLAAIATLTRTGALLGTPAYMAPELWRGETATAASDQFAFGVTLYEALARARPFEGATGAELRAAVDQGPTFAHELPDATRLRPILMRALAPRPADRYPSLDALLTALEPAPTVARRARAWLAVPIALGLAIAIGGVAVFAFGRASPADRCGAGASLAAQVLDTNRATRIRAAFATSGASWAAGAADRALAALNAYCTQWAAAHRATCEATELRHEQSPALLDARMHCLNRGLGEAAALATRLEHPDQDTILHATEATSALPPIAGCADTAALGAMESPPTGEKAAALAQLEPRIAAAHVAAAAGATSTAAIANAREIADLATVIGYRPTIAESRLLLATFLRRSGAFADAAHEADAALVAAEASHDDREAALVWIELLALRGEAGSFADAIADETPATAALARIGTPPDLDAALRFELGVARTNQQDFPGAKRDLDASLATRERIFGSKNLDVARTLTALGNLARVRGDLDEALALHERALAIDTELLGADHPALARHHHNIGGVLRLQGKLDLAQAEYEHALDLETKGLGQRSLAVGRTENSLGLVAIAKQDWPSARAHLERAKNILAGHPDRALAIANLAIVDAAEKKSPQPSARPRPSAMPVGTTATTAPTAPTAPPSSAPTVPPRPSSAPTAQGSYGPAQTFDTERH